MMRLVDDKDCGEEDDYDEDDEDDEGGGGNGNGCQRSCLHWPFSSLYSPLSLWQSSSLVGP